MNTIPVVGVPKFVLVSCSSASASGGASFVGASSELGDG
jgi:hypothetical protein